MSITINAYQLKQALEFVAPDYETDEDQRESEIEVERLPAGTFMSGEPRPAGLYVWLTDYPEEGCMLLEPQIGVATPDPEPSADAALKNAEANGRVNPKGEL